MKVATLYKYEDIRIEEMPVPSVGPHDALIRTKASGICSGDTMKWYIEQKAPLVLGHEPSGIIVEVGKKVSRFKTGERVFAHHHASCCSCRRCLRGDSVHCSSWKENGLFPGGISEYILVHRVTLEHDTHVLSDNCTFADGTLIEPAACVVKALRRASLRRNDSVLVIGLGFMGQLHVLLARKYGAGTIIGADMVPFRLMKAKEFGADEVVDITEGSLHERVSDITDGNMPDIVIVCPNSIEAMKQGISLAGPGGKVVFFTPAKPGEALNMYPNDLYFKDISIISSYSCGPEDTIEALRFIEEGIVKANKLVTHRFPIEETEQAYRLTAKACDSLKSIIVFD